MMHLARRTIGGWEEFKGLPYSPYLPPPYFPNSQKVSYLLEKELMTMLGLELERVGREVGGGEVGGREGGKSRAQRWERRHQRGCTAPPTPPSSSSSPEAGPVVAACGATTTDWIRPSVVARRPNR